MLSELHSQESTASEKKQAAQKMEKRDGEIYVALGLFILAVGIPVLLGTYFAAQTSMHAAVVNAVCAVTLLCIGVAAIVYGRIVLARNKRRA